MTKVRFSIVPTSTTLDDFERLLCFQFDLSRRSSPFVLLTYCNRWWRQWLRSQWPPIGNGIWAIKWSRDRWHHVTPKGAPRQYVRLS